MWNWLNTNAGAVQAMSAVAVTVLTIVLALTTVRYTRLTSRIAKVTEKQLQASVQPVIEISLTHTAFGSGTDGETISTILFVKNSGNAPLKISKVMAVATVNRRDVGANTVPSMRDIVLMPGKRAEDWATIYVSPTVDKAAALLSITVDCTDLAESSEQRFILTRSGQLRHSPGFHHRIHEHWWSSVAASRIVRTFRAKLDEMQDDANAT